MAGSAVDPVVRQSQHADFQSGAALALARRLGRPPRAIATAVAGQADLAGLAAVGVSGPDLYARLGVTLTAGDFVGESCYQDQLASVVDGLAGLGLLVESEGALCVFPPGFTGRDGEPLPLIVRKSDGGFGYAATDLAALRHRVRTVGADRLLYVVGAPQRTHFRMVFAVCTGSRPTCTTWRWRSPASTRPVRSCGPRAPPGRAGSPSPTAPPARWRSV